MKRSLKRKANYPRSDAKRDALQTLENLTC